LTDQPLVARLESLLRDHFEIAPEALCPDATFRELEIDSLAMAEMLAIIEDEDGVSLPPNLPGLDGDTTLADGLRIIAEAAEAAEAAQAAEAASAAEAAEAAAGTECAAAAQPETAGAAR
jgi:acyl carrier protein